MTVFILKSLFLAITVLNLGLEKVVCFFFFLIGSVYILVALETEMITIRIIIKTASHDQHVL